MHIEPIELEGRDVVRVSVEAGDEKPYYLASKGLVPAGVFTRLGPATVPMGRRDIRRMIREADDDFFETRHARMQDLTFETARRVFREHGVEFSPERYRALGFLRLANNLRSYFPSNTRIDQRDYPDDALREGMLNAIIHRDYDESRCVPTLVKMYRTELSFTSFGGLFGITAHQAITRESSPRNPRLLALFGRLGEVEAYGSGLPKIWKLYEREGLRARIEAEGSFFTLVLPNINTVRNPLMSLTANDGPDLRGGQEAFDELDEMGALPARVKEAYDRACAERLALDCAQAKARTATPAARAPAAGPAGIRITRAERIAAETPGAGPGRLERFLVSFALERGEFSREEAQRALDAGRDTTLKVINGMVASGALVKTGRARATRYRVSDDLRRAGDAGWPV